MKEEEKQRRKTGRFPSHWLVLGSKEQGSLPKQVGRGGVNLNGRLAVSKKGTAWKEAAVYLGTLIL